MITPRAARLVAQRCANTVAVIRLAKAVRIYVPVFYILMCCTPHRKCECADPVVRCSIYEMFERLMAPPAQIAVNEPSEECMKSQCSILVRKHYIAVVYKQPYSIVVERTPLCRFLWEYPHAPRLALKRVDKRQGALCAGVYARRIRVK